MLKLTIGCLLLLCLLATFASAEILSSGMDADTFIQTKIQRVDVMVFAKSYCGYCRRTRELFKELHDNSWTLDIIDLDLMPEEDGPLVQMELLTATGQKTVPSVFIHGKHVGGNSDVMELYESGRLMSMIKATA
jgi:glutaredoxin 3